MGHFKMPTISDNIAEETDVQTLQASFAPRTLSAHCGQKGGVKE
jgi:hypothetical protein